MKKGNSDGIQSLPLNQYSPAPNEYDYAPIELNPSSNMPNTDFVPIDNKIVLPDNYVQVAPPIPLYIQPVPAPPKPVHSNPQFNHNSVPIVCPHCHQEGVSKVDYEAKGRTYGFMAGLFCVCWALAFVPLCINDSKYAVHKCPHCSVVITEVAPCQSS